MSAYLDASALTAILLREPGWQGIAGWLAEKGGACCYSDFTFGEFRSALGIRVRRGEATADYGTSITTSAREHVRRWTLVYVTTADIADASDMLGQFHLALRLPDAIHIAVARRLQLSLVTTDARQLFGARALGVDSIDPSKVPLE